MTDSKAKNSRNTPLRRFYDWSMKECEKPYAFWFLNAFAFAESIFIPIPTDPFLVAKATAEPKKALSTAAWVSLSSILGGIVGYYLGLFVWDTIAPFIFDYLIAESTFDIIKARFSENVFLFVVLGAFTFLPFKAFALTAGSMSLPLLPFILGCIVGRSLRFMTFGVLIYFFGPSIKTFIDKWLEVIFIILGLLVVLFIAFKYLH